MKGTALVVLRIPTLGCSFQVLGKNDGRLMLVFQSTRVSNVSPYRTCRSAPVVSGRSYAWRPWTLTLVTLVLFPQFHRPTRSGVVRLMVVWRLSLKRASVAGPRLSPGTGRGPLATWNCWSLLKVKPRDRVIHG